MSAEIVLNYIPHGGQLPFHEDRFRIKNRALIAATASGKSMAGAFEALSWALMIPGSVGLIAVPVFRMVKSVVIPLFERILGVNFLDASPIIRKLHLTDMKLELENGSIIWMVGLDRPELTTEGLNLDWAWCDEPRLVHDFSRTWRSIQRRLRGSGRTGAKPIVGCWATTTPDFPGSPLHKTFEDPVTRDTDSKVYRMMLDQNPYLPSDYVEAIKRAHTGSLYRRFVLGLFAAVEGVTFSFDYAAHVEGFNMPMRGDCRIVYGMDVGWTSPSCILAVLLDPDMRAFVVDEVYQSRLSTEQLVAEAKRLVASWGEGPVYVDPSSPRMVAALEADGIPAKPAKHKREDGIRELGGRFGDAGDGRRRLYVHKRCVNLIRELQVYDSDRKEFDHAVDSLRYALASGAVESQQSIGMAFLEATAPRRQYRGPRMWRP